MRNKSAWRVLRFAVLVLLAAVALFPVAYTVGNSFMSPQEVAQSYQAVKSGRGFAAFRLLPTQFSLQAYYDVFLARPNYLLKFWVSLLLCVGITGGQVLISCLGGLAFAKFRFRGDKALFCLLLLFMLLPVQVTLLPNYLILDTLGLLNSWWALLLPAVFSPFGTFLMALVFRGVPSEMMESARLDGAGTWQVLFRVMAPCAKPGLAAVAVLTFIDGWNLVEQPMVFLNDPQQYPLSIFLASVSNLNFSLQFVCGILSLLPVALLFLFFSGELAEGIAVSGMK